eukprot:scaffold528_cov165-Amphora_coffeaeformis.AAC.28
MVGASRLARVTHRPGSVVDVSFLSYKAHILSHKITYVSHKDGSDIVTLSTTSILSSSGTPFPFIIALQVGARGVLLLLSVDHT